MKKEEEIKEEFFEKVAKEKLFIETLKTRMSDSKDFHDVSVWGLKDAFEEIYKKGLEDGSKK